ncbi:glycosyltransferase family 4 protein [Niveispirillum cyanobacteriorum]|uniref:Glycosyl transferase family 1 n=1 Tax=Niveispirillum cyanobacteriorum TaxID=1612173 RepID=A0A2K9NNM4_9PROT|nr:glycosyltransferase family 4 protein [Niveispirillum cyanobacteriorum]AUN33945.1 glycosyl transferase family 1 [Niveispirillum cyanobacteriorum]GGE86263.1 glycosyl transferase family 1 [Niveispirillum cyanobacteriorum]
MYKVLFLHNQFPGQFLHLAPYLARLPGVQVDAMASDPVRELAGVTLHRYSVDVSADNRPHPYLIKSDQAIWRGQAVLAACVLLSQTGYRPNLVIGHNGWGELLYLKDLWPDVPVIGYCEFYYHGVGVDVGFDPPGPVNLDMLARVRSLNAHHLLGMAAIDRGISPTRWQHDLHPAFLHPKLSVIHDGIDTQTASPGPAQPLILPDGRRLEPGMPLVTYIARDLEPYRGFPIMMRAAAHLLRSRPDLRLVIAGGDGVSYGTPPPDGGTWRAKMLAELGDQLPLDRVHFLGTIPHADFINLMRLSSAHVYLTYPFVLSWSMLEAMACGVSLVASDTPPVREVVEQGRNGILVPFHDPVAVAAGLGMALDIPPGQRQAMRNSARQTVIDHYDLNRVALPAWLTMLHREFGLPYASPPG